LTVEVFGVGHERRSGVWAAAVIRRGKPDIVCFEAWAEFVKLFNYFDSGKIDTLSDDSHWKEVLPLLKWYWNFTMSILEKEPMMRAAKEVGAEPIAIDVSIEERMRQQSQYIREVRKKAGSFKMRVWFVHKIFSSLTNIAVKPFGRFPNLMNSTVGKVYFQTSRRLWDWISPESKWWGAGREEYMTQKIAEILNKHIGCRIFVFVGATHKWNLQHLVDTRLLAKR
jgi:hypothetical protein